MPRNRTISRLQFVRVCACGCGQPTLLWTYNQRTMGRVGGLPAEFLHGHQSVKHTPEYLIDENGCWIWQRALDPQGYGHISRKTGSPLAHKVYWERVNGPVPDGLVLDHVAARGCRSRACCNPAHLEPVTNQENVRRSSRAKMTPELIREIRALFTAGVHPSYAAVGATYGLHPKTVGTIVRRDVWADVA